MSTMLIAFNGTRENGNFMGDQLCYLKVVHMFVKEPGVSKVIMTMSPGNEMHFLWEKFIRDYDVEVSWDGWCPGDWTTRWDMWDRWRTERSIDGVPFDHYREMYLRIHGAQRQTLLCGYERGLGRRNIYEYVVAGQENVPDVFPDSDVYDVEIDHPPHEPVRDVWISPHCKTQGNYTFTFEYWAEVVRRLLDAGVSVTLGYDGPFWDYEFNGNPLYRKHWGTHQEWMEQICQHKIVACGNTGTGWLAAVCGVPLFTMEPPDSQMPDHRYRECGLRNIVEVLDKPDAEYCARRLVEEVNRKTVMTTGCYDVLHAGHVRHLERSKALGTRLIVALNSDTSVKALKGPDRPINPQHQRKAVLEALRCVDEVRVFDGPNALPLIEEIKPDVLTAGYGYEEADIIGGVILKEWGGRAVVTCKGDAKDETSTTKIVQRVRRSYDIDEICRAAMPYSVNPLDKLKLMACEFFKVAHLPGDVADLGSYRGGSALVLRRLAQNKLLHVFDTWEGTPYDDPLCHHKRGEWVADIEACKDLVCRKTEPTITGYYKGIFPSSVECNPVAMAGARFCFVYVDMDTYQATRDAIEFFLPRLVSGGKLFFDDYGWEPCAGVRKAVDEKFTDYSIEWDMRVIQTQYACVVTKR